MESETKDRDQYDSALVARFLYRSKTESRLMLGAETLPLLSNSKPDADAMTNAMISKRAAYRPGQACGSIQEGTVSLAGRTIALLDCHRTRPRIQMLVARLCDLVTKSLPPEVTYATFPDHGHHSVSALEPLRYIESATRTITVKRSLKPSLRFAPFFGPVRPTKNTFTSYLKSGSTSEWTPEPPDAPHSRRTETQRDLASAPVVSGASGPWPKLANTGKQVLHLASYDFTGLAGNETSKLWPLGFYGTIGASVRFQCAFPTMNGFDLQMDLERSIADFLGTDASIPYLQGFSTISCVVSAFAKRGDIIIADRGINFVVQKGLETSHSTGRCFDHNDLRSLEGLFLSVEKECRKRFGPLTRRFIVPEGIFEKGCTMVDHRNWYKYRLVLLKASPLAQWEWAEPDAAIHFLLRDLCDRWLSRKHMTKRNIGSTRVVGSVPNGFNSSGGYSTGLADRHGWPTHQPHLVRFLRNDPGGPGGPRLGGHQHPAEHAFIPEHAGERGHDLSRAGRPSRSPRMPPHRSSTSVCVLRRLRPRPWSRRTP
ncbi:hypothetical protein EDB83DRAFT_2318586 [Lactarius deliciosus]|nr:hypothetical protein EDB83DRAFT_2318586 [Lactarius deliciosus]